MIPHSQRRWLLSYVQHASREWTFTRRHQPLITVPLVRSALALRATTFPSYNTPSHSLLFLFFNRYPSINCITFGLLQSIDSLVLSIWRKPLSLRNDNDNIKTIKKRHTFCFFLSFLSFSFTFLFFSFSFLHVLALRSTAPSYTPAPS